MINQGDLLFVLLLAALCGVGIGMAPSGRRL